MSVTVDKEHSVHVRRRKVFYVPGYDPFPPRRYRELYRKEGQNQAALCGYILKQTVSAKDRALSWHAFMQLNGLETQSDIEVLPWADLVKTSMSQSILGTYGQLIHISWIYISTGALWRLTQLRKGPVIAALYPIGVLLLQLALALYLGFLISQLLPAFLGAWRFGILPLVSYAVLLGFRRLDHRFFVYYLMHDYAHSAQNKGAYPSELIDRLGIFQSKLHEARHQGYDEILLVGHSSGAHLAISVLAKELRRHPHISPTPLALLTLGHVVPMLSFLPMATQLRQDLFELSTNDEITWLDVTAPGDGCTFALCDPVSVSIVPPSAQRWPLVISASFTQTLRPETWAKLRWRFFRLHFQYLCAFDQPKDYDYFQITAGPLTLGDRYQGRPASRSRITKTLSPYTGRVL